MQKETLNLTAWEQIKEKVKRWFGKGEYGTSRDLKQTNGELYSNIINLFKGIISNYSNAQKSLDNKIKILNDLNMKIGLDIKEFNF